MAPPGISSNPASTLMQSANFPLDLPSQPEVCPIGMAPTTSTTISLVIGDCIAVALLKIKGYFLLIRFSKLKVVYIFLK